MKTRNVSIVEHNGNRIPVYTSTVKAGDTFKIDGITETVAKVDWEHNQYWFICDSCACYSETDLGNVKD